MYIGDWKPNNRHRFEKWLGEMGFEEKLKTLETGMRVECIHCFRDFYDKQSPEERNLNPCKAAEHNCFDVGRYAILKRGFIGIIWATKFDRMDGLAEAVLNFFKNY